MKAPAWRRRLRLALAEAGEQLGYEAVWLLVPSPIEEHWFIAERTGRPGPWQVVVTSELVGCFPEGFRWDDGDPLPQMGERLTDLGCRALAIVPMLGGARIVMGSSAHRTGRAADEAARVAIDNVGELAAPLMPTSSGSITTEGETGPGPTPDVEEVALLLSVAPWSDAQRTALVTFARAEGGSRLTDEDLSVLLSGAARLGVATDRAQRPVLSLIARSIGVDRLISSTKLEGDVRLGAAWLLIEEGSLPALRTVASLGDDKREEVRIAAAMATSMLRRSDVDV